MAKNYFLANNGMSSLNMFYYRKLYNENVLQSVGDKRIDLLYDIPLYGKVDMKNYSIYLSESNLKQLESDQNTFLALDFVVDAFDDLQGYFQKAIILKKIKSSGFIAKMVPQKAWVSATNLHHTHIDILFKMFTLGYLKGFSLENKIQTIEDFLYEFLNFVEQIKTNFPITRSSFISSRFCSVMSSGLAIEIEDKNRDDDSIKQKDILDDENYIFFKNAAKRFGFFIDQAIPWRLVSDVGSSITKKYMKEYGISSENLFKNYYYKAIDYDFELLKNYMIQMWNSYIDTYPFSKQIKESCSGQKVLVKIVNREKYDIDYPKLNDDFWIDFYARIRFKESQKEWKELEINRKIKNAIDIKKSLDILSAVYYIEGEVK